MLINLVNTAYAVCDPGSGNINLGDCLTLESGTAIQSSPTYSTPAGLINLVVSNLFVIAGIVLFILIIYAGFRFISSDTKGKDDARTIMTGAITGFIVMFAAYWIVQIIRAVTGADIII